MLTSLAAQYESRIDAMSPQERVARSAAMFQWFRDMIGRQIRQELAADGTTVSDDVLKLRIALRMYESEPTVAALIRRRLDDVSR
jgi:hypothetical protein